MGTAVEGVDEDLQVVEGGGEDDAEVSVGFVGVFGHKLVETALVALVALAMLALDDGFTEEVRLRREILLEDRLKLW